MLVFEVARRLTRGGQPPIHLLISAARGPHLRSAGPCSHQLPDGQFLCGIRDLEGTPPEVLAHENLLEMMLPTLRADFTAAETFRCQPDEPLLCPITVFGGTEAPLVSRASFEVWSPHSSGGFRLHLLPGNHFFLATARPQLQDAIGQALAIYLCASNR